MSEAGPDRVQEDYSPSVRFKPLRVIIAVLAATLAVSAYANWYSEEVSLPRYCEDPEQSLRLLESVMTQERPAGEESRRPYLIAAKLLYLIPQEESESLSAYQARLRQELVSRCQ